MLTFEDVVIAQSDFRMTADLTLTAGITAVIGPSGAGKSTLLAAAAGFLEPESGRVICAGKDLGGVPPGQRPVSLLFQDHNLFPHLTVAQNVGLALRPGLRLTADQKAQVAAALAKVGLSGYDDRKPGTLSGGQQSRAALARVLVADRPVVLLDEPFAALGPALKDEMLGLVREMLADAGKTVVMVTHDPDDARKVADEVVLVADGTAMPPRDMAEIFADPPAVLKAYLGNR